MLARMAGPLSGPSSDWVSQPQHLLHGVWRFRLGFGRRILYGLWWWLVGRCRRCRWRLWTRRGHIWIGRSGWHVYFRTYRPTPAVVHTTIKLAHFDISKSIESLYVRATEDFKVTTCGMYGMSHRSLSNGCSNQDPRWPSPARLVPRAEHVVHDNRLQLVAPLSCRLMHSVLIEEHRANMFRTDLRDPPTRVRCATVYRCR